MSKSKMSIGRPMVVHAFGIYHNLASGGQIVERDTDIDNSSYVTLDGDATQHQIDLIIIIPVTLQIFDDAEA